MHWHVGCSETVFICLDRVSLKPRHISLSFSILLFRPLCSCVILRNNFLSHTIAFHLLYGQFLIKIFFIVLLFIFIFLFIFGLILLCHKLFVSLFYFLNRNRDDGLTHTRDRLFRFFCIIDLLRLVIRQRTIPKVVKILGSARGLWLHLDG